MSLVKCPKCSEMFSDSYKSCPFCAEDEEFYGGKVKKHARRKQESHRKTPSVLGPIMVVVVLLIAFLVWLLALGGFRTISNMFGGETVSEEQQSDGLEIEPTDADPVSAIALDPSVLNMNVGDSAQLNCTGAENVDWSCSAPTVVTVNSNGEVTALEAGTAIITATDQQSNTAVCSVTVLPAQDTDKPEGGDSKPSDSGIDLSKLEISVPAYGTTLEKQHEGKFDVSMKVGESFVLKVNGVSGAVSWSSKNSNIASISSDATLKGIYKGETTVVGSIGGSTFEILVRVN